MKWPGMGCQITTRKLRRYIYVNYYDYVNVFYIIEKDQSADNSVSPKLPFRLFFFFSEEYMTLFIHSFS